MAAKSTQINIENFSANLVRLERNVIQFGGIHDNKIPDISNDLKEIRKYVEDEKKSAQAASKAALISNLGNVVVTSINSLEDLTSNDPRRVMKGSLNIAVSIATVVGGPYGAAAAALSSILGAVISAASPQEPDLASKFAEVVHVELQKFNRQMKEDEFSGLKRRVKTMNEALDRLSKEEESAHIDNLIDNLLYERDLPQFIGEVANAISKGLSQGSSKTDCEDCVRAMVVYCNSQATLLILLANIMAKLTSTGQKTKALQNLFETEKENARQFLEFLSDEENLTPSAYLPEKGGKLFIIIALRGNITAYEVVEGFRESLGLSKMPDIDVIREKAFISGLYSVKRVSHSYAAPHKKGDAHYFQFINHTDLPVKLECGAAGDHVNGLKFVSDVMPRTSYEHKATGSTFPYWNFSTGGYFIIYLDGTMRDYQKRFSGNIKVFEFALSNPFIGDRKSALMEKTDNVFSVNGTDCWKSMNSPYFGDPIFFVHSQKHYRLKASLGGIRDIFKSKEEDTDQGKNGCRTWRYVLQEFDPLEDMTEACTIL